MFSLSYFALRRLVFRAIDLSVCDQGCCHDREQDPNGRSEQRPTVYGTAHLCTGKPMMTVVITIVQRRPGEAPHNRTHFAMLLTPRPVTPGPARHSGAQVSLPAR
jgi:hypothetical protein